MESTIQQQEPAFLGPISTHLRDFVCGAFALSGAFALMHPLENYKTLLQSQGSFSRSQLTPAILTRGLGTSVMGAAPQGGLRLMTYEMVRERLGHSSVSCAAAAVCGDVASSLVKVPREVLTQRLQAGMYQGNPWRAISTILRTDGVRGFYTGFLSTACRDMPFMVILFVTCDQLKRRSEHTVLCGGLSGAAAGLVTTPFDVVKTKVMTAGTKHISTGETCRSIWQKSGFRGFFVGAVPRTGWWFCVCSIFFPSYEALQAAMS